MFDLPTEDTHGPMVITGRKIDLDLATLWMRATLTSALGADKGERVFRTLPALPILLAYRRLVACGEVH